MHVGKVFEGAPHRGGGRAEIDLWVKINNYIFIIESKRSDYDWVFLQNKDADIGIHLITGPNKEVEVHNRILKELNCVSKQVIEVREEEDTPILCRQQKEKTLPVRSSREEYVRNALRQALFNTETLIHSHLTDPTWKGQAHRIFIPVVVTNTRLLSGVYSSSDIDDDAKLTEIDLNPIQVAAFNHAEILKWGSTYEKELVHIGQPAWGQRMMDDVRYKGTHDKTVFIVAKDHLHHFIDSFIKMV
jgi:hypothetical protein